MKQSDLGLNEKKEINTKRRYVPVVCELRWMDGDDRWMDGWMDDQSKDPREDRTNKKKGKRENEKS